MSKKKIREVIPSTLAAKVLFVSDRTCCVCRVQGKAVQIHHIDEDPRNNVFQNLAVVCFDCHRETQIKGGFDRKLDSDQIILYRDDWIRSVSRKRAEDISNIISEVPSSDVSIELATSVAEIYRENEGFTDLAIHYDGIGNVELRDKYVDLAIQQNPGDEEVCFLRFMQDKPELIPPNIQERIIKRLTRSRDWLGRARINKGLGKKKEALDDYLRGIKRALDSNRVFTGAYYLRELIDEGLLDHLFELALEEAVENGELWWQIRSLQELGWDEELNDLLLQREEEIRSSGDLNMLALLAKAKGDQCSYVEIEKRIARREMWGQNQSE